MFAWIAVAPGANATMIMKGVGTMISALIVGVGCFVLPALFVWGIFVIGGRK